MRVFVLAAMLLASSSLCSFAQEQGKAPSAAPQAGTPAPTDNSQPQQDQRIGRDQPKTEDREMGPDSKMRRGDGDRTGRDDREMGRGGMMRHGDGDRMGHDDHEMGQDWRMHRGGDMSREQNPGAPKIKLPCGGLRAARCASFVADRLNFFSRYFTE